MGKSRTRYRLRTVQKPSPADSDHTHRHKAIEKENTEPESTTKIEMEKQLAEILRTVKGNEAKLNDITEKLKTLEVKSNENAAQIKQLQNDNRWLCEKVEAIEHFSMSNNLIISGIPISPNENVKKIVTMLAKTWDINLGDRNYCVAQITAKKWPVGHNRKISNPRQSQ